MPHYLIAFASMLGASVCAGFAYSRYKRNDFQGAILLLMFAAFVLRFFVSSDQFLHEWDERYHALVAKNLMDNFFVPKLYRVALLPYDYHQWSSGYIWLHKQPLPLWCMAGSMKVFGVNEIALRLPSVMLSTIAVYLTYFIGSRLLNQEVGLLAAFFQTINGLIIEITAGRVATDHIDIFFLFFIELAIVFAVMHKLKPRTGLIILSGICIGLAVLCKWLPAFIVLPVWLILNYDRIKPSKMIWSLCILVVSSMVIFIPWQIYAHWKFPLEYSNEMSHNYRHLVEVLDGNGGGIFYFFEKIFISVNEFVWIAFAWFCYRVYKGEKLRNGLALLVWVLLPFLFFSMAKTKMQGYLLFVYPSLFIILAAFCSYIFTCGNSTWRIWAKMLFVVIIGLSIRYSVERIKPVQNQEQQLLWANEFRQMEDKKGTRVYFSVHHCIEGMFYTNSIMYEGLPTVEQIDDLKNKGYEVIINQNPAL